MDIDLDFINIFAGEGSANLNGKKLATSGSYSNLRISSDKTLLFGNCEGSGKTPYNCSVDFINPEKGPVPRCSCPSRQIPCKHTIGLLYCYHLGLPFTEMDVPEDVARKREKAAGRKSAVDAEAKPKMKTKAKATASIKKCKAQLEGIEIGERLLKNIALTGILSLDQSSALKINEQLKELGNYYIPGIQASFGEFLSLAAKSLKSQDYTLAIDKMNYIRALLRKAKEHTLNKIHDLEAFPENPGTALNDTLHSSIEEQMGYAWKLTELEEYGLKRTNEEVVQVSFLVTADDIKAQWVDEGVWISLSDGMVFCTCGYRPYKAKLHMVPEDTTFPVICLNDMYVYPGDLNPRARWDSKTNRDVSVADLVKIMGFAASDFKAVIKAVLSQTKNPLSDKSPIALLKVNELRQNGNDYAVVDENGNGIFLKLDWFSYLLKNMSKSEISGKALVCRFANDIAHSRLYAIPLALVSEQGIFRFYC
jgi:hypothetical protein